MREAELREPARYKTIALGVAAVPASKAVSGAAQPAVLFSALILGRKQDVIAIKTAVS